MMPEIRPVVRFVGAMLCMNSIVVLLLGSFVTVMPGSAAEAALPVGMLLAALALLGGIALLVWAWRSNRAGDR